MAPRVTGIAISLLSLFTFTQSKVYERCELAHELRDVHEIPEHQLATWLCITNYESHYDTSAHNPGSGDHGLFQISELYWCSPPGVGTACGVSCADLKNDDIEDDVVCARRIHRQHQRLSGDGFTAWVVYNLHCKEPTHVASFLNGCFDDENLIKNVSKTITSKQPTQLKIPSTPKPHPVPSTFITTSKPISRTISIPTQPSKIKIERTTSKAAIRSSTINLIPKDTKAHQIGKFEEDSEDVKLITPKPITKQPKPVARRTTESKLHVTSTLKPNNLNSNSNNIKAREIKGSSEPLRFKKDEKVYSMVENPGYRYAISSNGFKFFWTGKL